MTRAAAIFLTLLISLLAGISNGATAELSFSGGGSVQEADSTGTVEVELIRGSDWGGGVGGVLYTIRDDGTNPVQRSYNAYNSRGDVVSTSGDSGTATWQAAYEAFGTRTAEDGSNNERQRANTKDEDPTGLLNEGHRYRDLEAGVFISRDPAGFVDGPNVYAYVAQNPWSAFDPDGLFLEWLDNVRARHAETKSLGIDAGLAYTLFGPQPKAVRDVVEFDQRFKLAERTGGAAKVVGGTLEAGIGVVAAPVSGGVSLAGFAHGLDVATSGWSDVWSGQSSRTLTHQVIGGYSMMAGADFETADKIGGFSDAAASMGTTGVNSLALSRSPGMLTARSTVQASAAEGAANGESRVRLNIFGAGEARGFRDVSTNSDFAEGRPLTSGIASGSVDDIFIRSSPLSGEDTISEIIRLSKPGTRITIFNGSQKQGALLKEAFGDSAETVLEKTVRSATVSPGNEMSISKLKVK